MRILWLFPPSPIKGSYPNVSQYRFFKYMPVKSSIIYPYMASVGVSLLKDLGMNVSFLDCPTEDITGVNPEYLMKFDWVIMELRTPMANYVYKYADMLRSNYVRVLFYGDHAMYRPDEALKHGSVVIGCGDYDWGVYRFFKNYDPEAHGLCSYGLCVDLNGLPAPDRVGVPYRHYYEAWRHRRNFFWTMSMRGCCYDCTYCAWARSYWGNRVRYRRADQVADEYAGLVKRYGKVEVLDDADLFDTRWGNVFAEELKSRGLTGKQVIWAFQTHPNMIDGKADLGSMYEAGLRLVKLGCETGNQGTLNRVRKGLTVAQSEKAISLLKEHKIQVHINMMVGFPWETREEAYHSIEWIKGLEPNQAQFSLLIPYPWTEMAEDARVHRYYCLDPDDWDNYTARMPMLSMEGLSGVEIADLYRECWKQFYFDPKFIFKKLLRIRHLSGFRELYSGYRSIRFGHMRAMN